MHIVSILLFVALVIFIFTIFLQLCLYGTEEFSGKKTIDLEELLWPNNEDDESGKSKFWEIVGSVCTLLVAFSFALNLFPIYSALRHKSNENCIKSV